MSKVNSSQRNEAICNLQARLNQQQAMFEKKMKEYDQKFQDMMEGGDDMGGGGGGGFAGNDDNDANPYNLDLLDGAAGAGALLARDKLYNLEQESSVDAFSMGSSDIVKQLVWESYVIGSKKHYQDKDIVISSSFYKWAKTLSAMLVLFIQFYLSISFNIDQQALIDTNLAGDGMPTNMAFPHLVAIVMLCLTMFMNIYWHLAATFFAYRTVTSFGQMNLWAILVFLMSCSQIVISFFLLVVSYKLIILQDGILSVFKSYAAVFFIYILDDRVGDFFHPFFKQYSSYMSFQFGCGDGEKDNARNIKLNLLTMLSMFFTMVTMKYSMYGTKNHVNGLTVQNEVIGCTIAMIIGLITYHVSKCCVDKFRRPQFDGDSASKYVEEEGEVPAEGEGGEKQSVQNKNLQAYGNVDDEFQRCY